MKSKCLVAWLLSYISIASVSAAIITPALPEIQREFSLGLGAVEWVVSVFLLGYVLGQLIYGPLANTIGRLKSLRLGLIINLIGLLICLIAVFYKNYYFLLVGRLITGLGAASGLACTFILIGEWLPESQRKTAMAYSILSFALGIGFSVMIGGIITQYWHWHGCFIFLLAYSVVMLLGTQVFDETLIKSKPFQIKTLLRDYLNALSSLKLVTFSLLVGSCSMIGYCYSAAGPQIAQDYLNITASEYGYWNGLNIIGMLVGGLSARELLQRFSINQVIAFGFWGCGLGVFSLMLMWYVDSYSVIWFFMTTAVLYLSGSYFFAGGSSMALNALEDKANASSMMSFINMSFATFTVILMGYLSRDPFIGYIFILSTVFLLMLGLLGFWFYMSHKELVATEI